MNDRVFLDTNFLVYIFSGDEIDKKSICTEMLIAIKEHSTLIWSTQVIQEFYNTVVLKHGQESVTVKKTINSLNEDFELVTNNLSIINSAIDIHQTNHISFWDSLIVSAAKAANCSIILSEDLNHGQKVEGITVQSPLK